MKSMYENMQLQSNPIYQAMQQYDKLLDEGIISQEDYDKIMKTLNFGLTNPEGFTYSDSYGVFDENGKEIKNFQTQEDADKYMAENPDKNYSVNMIPDGWVGYSGSGTGDNTEPDPDDPDSGTSGDPLNPFTTEEWGEKSLVEQSDYFLETVPDPENWDYKKWEAEGKPQTFDAWEKENIQTVEDIEKVVSQYKDTGWPSFQSPDEAYRKLVEDGRNIFENRQGEVWNTSFDDIMDIYNNHEGHAGAKNLAVKQKFVEGTGIKLKGDPGLYVVQSVPSDQGNTVYVVDIVTGKKKKLTWYNGKAYIQ